MSGLFALDRYSPNVANTAWIAPNAAVIGNVNIGAGSSIWFNSVLRGDFNAINIGADSNIQDCAIIHVSAESPATIGDEVTVGHGAILHGCTLMDRVLVGMGAIVLDGALIESDGMLAAGGLLTPGKRIEPRQLWAGSPAKFMRQLTDDETRFIRESARIYSANASQFARSLAVVR